MSRTETIALINDRLPSLADDQLRSVAEITEAMHQGNEPARPLTARELALIEQSKADFVAGRTLTHAELVVELDERLAKRGVPKSQA